MSEAEQHGGAVIQSAMPSDFAEIASLAAVIWRAHYPGIISLEQINYMLVRMYDIEVMRRESEGGVTYDRLLLNGALIGFAAYGPAPETDEIKVHKLYVHPAFQRRGFGALLLKRVEKSAVSRGFGGMILAVNKRNANAIAAYLKYGFSIRELITAGIGGGFVMDDYVMAKAVKK